MSFGSRVAAMHSALWNIDQAYRLWWRIWPASAALLICGWIYVEKPATPASARWGRPADSAPVKSASGSAVPGKQSATQIITTFPEKLRNDAQSCYDNTPDLSRLIQACSRLIESGLLNDEQLAASYNQRGFYYSGSQRDRAMSDYGAALRIRPDYPAALMNRSLIYLAQGQLEVALSDLNKAIGLLVPAQAARARSYRATIFLALKDYDNAALDLDESLRVDPDFLDAYIMRGMLEYERKRYDAALPAFDEFTKRAPTKAKGLIWRGKALEAMGRPTEALLAYENALKLEPNNTDAAAASERLRPKPADSTAPRSGGSAAVASKQPATEFVTAFPEKLRDDAQACYGSTPDLNHLIEACSRMIESGLLNDEHLVAVYGQRGIKYYLASRRNLAMSDYDAALKIRRDNPAILVNRSLIYMERSQADAALSDLNRAIALLAPANAARARLYRATAYIALKDFDKAIADINESQRVDPNDSEGYLARGVAEHNRKHYDAALQAYDEFSKRAPQQVAGFLGRAKVLEATGRRAEALLAYESALNLEPKNAEAIAARERLRPADGR
jgi:tetratricopeptide (TPR) repeat protein